MAYPKRNDFEKTAFIAKVFNLLRTYGKDVQYKNLEKKTDLDDKYETAKRLSREMGYEYKDVMGYSTPRTDFDCATAPIEEVTEDTEKSDVESGIEVSDMTAEEVQEHIQNHPSRSSYKNKQQNTIKQAKKERKKLLYERYSDILEFLQNTDDSIITNDVAKERRMINIVLDYADRREEQLKTKFRDRAITLLVQYYQVTATMQSEEIKDIEREVSQMAPQYAK